MWKSELAKKQSIKSFKQEKPKKALPTNPVLRASNTWTIISDQLETILGPSVYQQWFKTIRPVVISNNILILSTKRPQAAAWLNCNYRELVETLAKVQDKKLCCFFVSHKKLS